MHYCLLAGNLIVVRHEDNFGPKRERIAVPDKIAEGILTSLHFHLKHPSPYQLKRAFERQYFALDSDKTIRSLTRACQICFASQTLQKTRVEETTMEPPETMATSVALDVMKQNRQLILVIREEISCFTMAQIIPDETAFTLGEAIL